MLRRVQFPFPHLTKKTVFFFVLTLSLLLIVITVIRFNITGDCDGIFLLKGEGGALLEIKDDLFLGDGNRNVIGIDFEHGKEVFYRLFRARTMNEPYLYFEWNEKRGDGFI